MKVIISWFHDWYELLRRLYNPGIKKHDPLRVLGCASCGRASGDCVEDEHGWDGWTVAPVSICPDCKETGKAEFPEGAAYPEQLRQPRRDEYLHKLHQVKHGGNK